MDYRTPLKLHTVLPFAGMSCHVEGLAGQGSNAIVYKGWYWDQLNQNIRHHVLIKELFPFHPNQKIYRAEDGCVVVAPEAEELWHTHRKSFEIGNEVHLRLLYDHPELMVMGANLNSFQLNGTLYSVLGYTGGRSLQTELNQSSPTLRETAQRMIRLLDALEAFHKSGYLHLDISPDNIMLVGREERERLFLIDYNSARELNSHDSSYLSCKAGYSAPEVSTGKLRVMSFSSDLYSVAAVFYRCIMGRSLTLAEMLQPKAPDGQDSRMLQGVPETVASMVSTILKKGLHTLNRKRYQSIGQMRQAFQELLDRIDCVGVTHWSLWENGKRSVEELIRTNPSMRYLQEENKLYPIRLEQECSISLQQYLEHLLSSEGKSGLILAQGGMGKTTLLLHTATMLQEKRYTSTATAVFYISLHGWTSGDSKYIRSQILMRLRFKREENTFDSAMHALHQLLEQPLKTSKGSVPAVLLLLDGLNEVAGDIAPLIREVNELKQMAGVRILAASRSALPELNLETTHLMPLNVEDIEAELARNGLLLPRKQDVIQLLRTPLILSVFSQACAGGNQLDIQSEAELIRAYLDSLLDKEIRQLPEDSPQRWQIDAALNYVLPAIAIEAKRKQTGLSQENLLQIVTRCWKTLRTKEFRKAYPNWIGHSGDISSNAETAEEWFGIMIHSLLWQRLGMLTRDNSGCYRIYHQVIAEHLSDYSIPVAKPRRWVLGIILILVFAAAAAGYQHSQSLAWQEAVEQEIREVLELGAAGYVEYGELYRQLRNLLDNAGQWDTGDVRSDYKRVLSALEKEQERTASEETEALQVERSNVYDQRELNWGLRKNRYDYGLLSQLYSYPDQRAAFYAEQLPLLKDWLESEYLQEKTPDFTAAFSELLEADANLAAEYYHRAAGIHLSGSDSVWLGNMNALVAMIPELDAHRDTAERNDPGQRLNTLNTLYLKAVRNYEAESSKVRAYIRNSPN